MCDSGDIEDILFGSFSSDDVKTLEDTSQPDTSQPVVMFTRHTPSVSSVGRVTTNHVTSELRPSMRGHTGSSSPDFQFPLSSNDPSFKDYQFGSLHSTIVPSPASNVPSTGTSAMDNKWNVHAKEFYPVNDYGWNRSHILGGYPFPHVHPGLHPIPPHSFFFSSYNPMYFPVMADPSRFPHPPTLPFHSHSLNHASGLRPQIAVVAPYRPVMEPRPVSEKSFHDNKTGWSSDSQDVQFFNSSFHASENASRTKSLSPSPSSPPALARRTSSTGDITRTTDITDSPIERDIKTSSLPDLTDNIDDGSSLLLVTSPAVVVSCDMVEGVESESLTPPIDHVIDDFSSSQCEEMSTVSSPSYTSTTVCTSVSTSTSTISSMDISTAGTLVPTTTDMLVSSSNGTSVAITTGTSVTTTTGTLDSSKTGTLDSIATGTSTTGTSVSSTTGTSVNSTTGTSVSSTTGTSVSSSTGTSVSSTTGTSVSSTTGTSVSSTSGTSVNSTSGTSVNSTTGTSVSSTTGTSVSSTTGTSVSSTTGTSVNSTTGTSVSTTTGTATNGASTKSAGSGRSWASIVSISSATPTAADVERKTSVGGGVSKVGNVVDSSLSKEDNSKLEEKKLARLKHLGNQISSISINHSAYSVLPRGLINQSTMCYIHAPLQALVSCPEFTNLFRKLKMYNMPSSHDPSALVTIVSDNMIKLVENFHSYPSEDSKNGRKKKFPRDFVYERPFKPDFIYDILPRIKSSLSIHGRHEDAEELLGCFLNKIHEEMVEAKKSLAPPTPPPQIIPEVVMEEDILKEKDEGEWQEVGPKNKSTITRKIDYIESPISEIFGGKFHSALHRHGMKVSATVEPFFSLQLDIQSDEVHSLKNALELLAHKEAISLSDKDSIGATRRTTLLHLPPVLILHIKRFLFDGVKCRKLHKSITFDQDLEIPKDLLAPSVKGKLTYSQRSYRLWAVISHSGDTPDGGHYICESYHPPINGWLRHDDNYVKPVPPEQVFHSPHRSPYRVPYLFFYRQVDAVSGHRC